MRTAATGVSAVAGTAADQADPSILDAVGFDAWVRPHWRSMAMLAGRLAGSGSEDVLSEALLAA